MELSYRQARRIAKRFLNSGDAGLVHRSRGRVSNHCLDTDLKKTALRLFKEHYKDYGPTLASEVMAEEHGVMVHAEPFGGGCTRRISLLLARAIASIAGNAKARKPGRNGADGRQPS